MVALSKGTLNAWLKKGQKQRLNSCQPVESSGSKKFRPLRGILKNQKKNKLSNGQINQIVSL
jgi:hypothetical protein